MSGLHVAGLRKTYGAQPVLHGIDLVVPPGRVCALLGASGSGKTTLLRLLVGLERADAGSIVLDGRVLEQQPGLHVPAERRRVGYVPQEGTLFPHLTVGDNIGFGLTRAERRSGRVGDALALTGLAGLEARYPHQLSGGQQQRTALARALAPRPGLVLLDEPFAALDLSLRRRVGEDVTSLLRTHGTTSVLVTHDPEEAFACSDLVAVMADGAIAQCDTPAAIYRRPASPQVARLTGGVLALPATFRGMVADTPLGPVALSQAAPAAQGHVLLRPEWVRQVPAGQGAAARCTASRLRGAQQAVSVQLGSVTLDILLQDDVAVGDTVHLAASGIGLPDA